MKDYLEVLAKIVKRGIIQEGWLRGCHFKSVLIYSRETSEDWPTFIVTVLGGTQFEYNEEPTMNPAADEEVVAIMQKLDKTITAEDLEFDS
jgi:hypothetical protein